MLDTAIGGLTGKLLGAGNMSAGVRSGSPGHVFKTQLGRMRSGATRHVSPKTAGKMFAGAVEEYQIGPATAIGVSAAIAGREAGLGGQGCGCQ